jgi:hypothetical protein
VTIWLEELTGFDEDFFWENINVGYTTIANSLIYKDIGCLLENTEPSRRNYAALIAAHVLADDRLKKHADKNREEELDTKDMILGFLSTKEVEWPIFKNLITSDAYTSLIFSDTLEVELFLDKRASQSDPDPYWLISVYLANVDSVGGVPEFCPESGLKSLRLSYDANVQTFLQKFTMSYRASRHFDPEPWDMERFRFWRWDMANPHNPDHTSVLPAFCGPTTVFQPLDNVEFEEIEE